MGLFRYKLKHFKVFRKAHEELKELMFKIAQEEGADNPYVGFLFN